MNSTSGKAIGVWLGVVLLITGCKPKPPKGSTGSTGATNTSTSGAGASTSGSTGTSTSTGTTGSTGTTSGGPATWPSGASLTATLGAGGALELSWSAAQGSVQAYRISDSGAAVARTDGQTRGLSTAFPPGRTATFQVQAQGTDGAWTADGPTADVSAPSVDPAQVAPPLDLSGGAPISASASFLYTGDHPVVSGVAAGAIDPTRVAVLRGKVVARDGSALSGVEVKLVGHSEFGRSASRADGQYDLVATGGGRLTVDYWLPGYLHAQRSVRSPQGDFVTLPDVTLVPADSRVTPLQLGDASPAQLARGSRVSDSAGTRQATVFFPANTRASLTYADGTKQLASALSFRATEYTVGPSGPQAMPGNLPPSSAYTYAVELGADEVDQAGAQGVAFEQPVYAYVENYLGFPVGTLVPSGYYDRQASTWVASTNGRVLQVLSVQSGKAVLDVAGQGQPATQAELDELGVTADELQQLGGAYAAGASLWRVPLPHLTSYDFNWVPHLPPDAKRPDRGPNPSTCKDHQCQVQGSIIECEGQILAEELPVVGTPYQLRYQSDRVPGRTADRQSLIHLTDATVSAALKGVELEVQIAGQDFHQSFGPQPNQNYTFTWDGKDVYGRVVSGLWSAQVTVSYLYDPLYATPAAVIDAFAQANGLTDTEVHALIQQRLGTTWMVSLGTLDQRGLGLGGWSLSPAHTYFSMSRALYKGDGSRRTADSVPRAVVPVAGNGASFDGSTGPALKVGIGGVGDMFFSALTAGPDGTLYSVDQDTGQVLRIDRDRSAVQAVAGGGDGGPTGPARQANLGFVLGVAVANDGSLLIAQASSDLTGSNGVRHLRPDGTLETVAGTDFVQALPSFGPDGGLLDAGGTFLPDGGAALFADGGEYVFYEGAPATEVSMYPTAVLAGDDGRIVLVDAKAEHRVLEVGTDGRIRTLLDETGLQGALGGNPTLGEIALGPDGDLYAVVNATDADPRLVEVRADGTIVQVGGPIGETSSSSATPDGLPALGNSIGIYVTSLVVDTDHTISFVSMDFSGNLVRQIDPQGSLRTVASGSPTRLALDGQHRLYLQDSTLQQILESAPPPPGLAASAFTIPSEDGSELYTFDPSGKHLSTVEAMTGAVALTVTYADGGQLDAVTDAYGNTTRILHDAQGNPTAIVAPFGQQTLLSVDGSGYLNSVTSPGGAVVQLQHDPSGLLTQLTDPRGNVHTMHYGPTGLLQTDADPAGGQTTLSRQDTDDGYTVTTQTVQGGPTTHAVHQSPSGSAVVTTAPTGLTSTSLQTPNGETITTTPSGAQTITTYAPDPRFGVLTPIPASVTRVTPSGLASTVTTTRQVVLSDALNPLSLQSQIDQTTINGNTWITDYEAGGDGDAGALTITSPVGRTVTRLLDAQGRIVEIQRPNLAPTQFQYDAQGRVSQVQQGTRIIQMQYGGDGYLAGATDALSETTSTQRDADGRVTTLTEPLGTQTGIAYNASGDASSVTPPGKAAHQFQYTSVDETSAYLPPLVDGGSGEVQFAYDADKHLTGVIRADGTTVAFQHDVAGRLTQLTHSQGTIALNYNPDGGQLASVTGPDESIAMSWDGPFLTQAAWTGSVSATVGLSYDANFDVTAINLNNAAVASYTYDADNLVQQVNDLTLTVDPQNGLLDGTSVQSISSAMTYDTYGALATLDYTGPSGTLFHQDYTRDALGRITAMNETEPDGTPHAWGYTYDANGRLTQVELDGATKATYAYDANGNRLSQTDGSGSATLGAYDARDRLVSYGTLQYTYTPDGELATKTDTSTGAVTTFNYDAMGNLRTVAEPDGGSLGYLVDGMNRRVGEQVNGVLVRQFVYQDQLKPIAELDGQGNLVSAFVYATHQNVPDLIVKGSAEYQVITDHLGSVVAVVDVATGQVAEALRYDEWGNVLEDTNAGFQPFGFAGGLMNSATGLVRFGARDYEPHVGRWTARDPLLFGGGQSNVYVYTGNDPINFVDVFGTCGKADVFLSRFQSRVKWNWNETQNFLSENGTIVKSVMAALGKFAPKITAFATNAEAGAAVKGAVGLSSDLGPAGLAGLGGVEATVGSAAAGAAVAAGQGLLLTGALEVGLMAGSTIDAAVGATYDAITSP